MKIKKKLLINSISILFLVIFFFPLISALTITETHLTTTGTLYDIYVNGSITIDNLTITNTTISIYNLNVTGNFTAFNASQIKIYNLTASEPYNDIKYDNGTIVGFENIGDSYTIIMNAGQYFQVGNFYTAPSEESSSSESSGGSGGGSVNNGATYIPSQEEIKNGYTKQLAVKDKIRVNISNELHLVQVTGISSPIVTINVSSTPQIANLNIGGTKKFELTGDKFYDIAVTLNKIVLVNNVYKADLTVKRISDNIKDLNDTNNIPDYSENNKIIDSKKLNIKNYKKILYPMIIFITILVVSVIIAVISTKKFRRKHHYINYYSPQT